MAQSQLTNNQVRLFMMDKPELNTLIQGIQFSDDDINDAILMTVDIFNTLPPPINDVFTVETFPWRGLLLKGVSAHLLRSAAMNQASNNLSYAADGVSINDKDKAPIFLQIAQMFSDEFKELAIQVRQNINFSKCYGAHWSEWANRAFIS